ncbi:hypothetical protein EPUS_01977 [Endocarpon pusillum Z07020]|uniref:Protein FYV10 n=1 Tax=Endocarpon pusillum (strain Z07020 / HMAS-L-300199) TaxID=1263415 RepID=U1HUH7_ENDPU|nr:uncharacterized protein EPUS_01977 [Endocarpon pusillum Z07020]ERF74290.1 hypothetical protein EPUS_01977 [Endocarpon pusillum Z07020]
MHHEENADAALDREINNLMMDYFITEGYPSTARIFAAESNTQPEADFEAIKARVEIRECIHRGDLQTAIEKINELNPQLLDTDDSLHFSLLRLQLIELIRACTSKTSGNVTNSPDISTALQFATTHLAPLAPTNPNFLADLERTMALLIFPTDNLAPQLAELIDPRLRKSVANRVNEAILGSQGSRREAQINKLLHMRVWGEKAAIESKKIDIPDAGLGFGLDERPAAAGRGRTEQNGNGVMGSQAPAEGDGDTAMREGNGEGEMMVS